MTFVDEDDRKLVKEVVKQNQGKVQERVVPPASLKKWAAQVEQMAGDIERLVLVRLHRSGNPSQNPSYAPCKRT